MRFSLLVALALVCICSALTVERLQRNAAVIQGRLAAKTKAPTRLTLCRTDNRDPATLAKHGGFCPRKIVPPQVVQAFYNEKKGGAKEWFEFFKAHESSSFDYLVSFSSNCEYTSVADYEYFYQIDIDAESISADPVVKGLTADIATSQVTIFRGVDQNDKKNFEWDSFGCIPAKYITNYRKAKPNPKYVEGGRETKYLTEKKGDSMVLVYDAKVVINWDTYAGTFSTQAPPPPPTDLSKKLVDTELAEMVSKRKGYVPYAVIKSKTCSSAQECAQSDSPRCCFFPPTTWTSVCTPASGKNAAGLTCLDRPVAGDTVALCSQKADCSANTKAKECCYRTSAGTVAGVGVCLTAETNAFKKDAFQKSCKEFPKSPAYTTPPVSTASLKGF